MLDLLNQNEMVSSICRECSRRIVLTIDQVTYLLEAEPASPDYPFVVGRCDPCMWRILNGEKYARNYRRGI